MTYNAFGGTLNFNQSVSVDMAVCWAVVWWWQDGVCNVDTSAEQTDEQTSSQGNDYETWQCLEDGRRRSTHVVSE